MIFKSAKCRECGKSVRWQRGDKKECSCGGALAIADKWRILWRVNGKQRTKTIGTDYNLAKGALAIKEREVAERRSGLEVSKDMAWGDAVSKYLEWVKVNRGESTLLTYRPRLVVVLGEECGLEDYSLGEITPQVIERAKSELVLSGRKINTINGYLGSLSAMFNKLTELKFIVGIPNPVVNVDRLVTPDPTERYLTDDEIGRLLAEASKSRSPYVRTLIIVALNTGLRKSDVVGLKLSQIDFNANTIKISVKKKRKNKALSLAMTNDLRAELRAHIMRHRKRIVETGYLFPTPLPNKIVGRKDLSKAVMSDRGELGIRKLMDAAGIQGASFHTLRHTFATHFLMLNDTSDALIILKDILAHEKIETTMRYAHVVKDRKMRAIEEFKITNCH